MRFYKRDGSYKINQEDSEFGWWLYDISAEENVDDKVGGKRQENESLIFEQNEVEDSVDLTCLFECSKKLIVEKHEPSVEIHVPVSAQRSQMSPEGYVRTDNLNPFNLSDVIWCSGVKEKRNKKLLEYENSNSIRTRLSAMITSDTLQGKLLISLMDYARFKKFIPSLSPVEPQEPILELQGHSIFFNRQFIFDKLENSHWISCRMKTECYRKRKSLLEEMPFMEFITNKYCPQKISLINHKYPANHKETRRNLKASEKLNCLPLDCLKLSETDAFRDKFLECTEVLYRNLRKLNETIREMQMDLIDIRMDFQEEDRRTSRLLEESKKLTRELRESNYLNEVLLLLMGQAEKVKSNNWPFKICSNQKGEVNFIV